MSHSLKVRSVGLLLLVALIVGAIWFSPLGSLLGHKSITPARAASPLPPNHTSADGPYKVQGNAILGVDGARYIFHGVGRDGLEFSCTGDSYMDTAHLAFMGPGTSGPAGTYWWANTVRLPLSEGFWLRGYSAQFCSFAQYQALVKRLVDTLTAMKLNVILDLQWTDAGGQSMTSGAGWAMPDSDSVTFWTQVGNIYKSYSNVLFELYNEPHPSSWTIWQQGGTITDTSYQVYCHCIQTFTYKAVGMQAMVNAARATGATNLVLVGGQGWGYDLSQLGSFPITGTNVVFDTHPYPYTGKEPTNWDASFGNASLTVPVMSAENGEYDCQSSYMSQLLPYLDAHLIGWTSWAWYSVGSACKYPQLVADYQGTPAPNMGAYVYQHLLSYAGLTPPPPAAGPVSTKWYFAEGRAGGNFREYLTLGNPTSSNCSVSIQYLYTPDHGTAQTKTVSVNVPSEQRITEYVDTDLGTSPTGIGISDSAIVTASGCPGIVAERPMYFNALGVNSGSDTLGATGLFPSFYFGDLAEGGQPGSGTYYSFLTILNPPGGATANVTATYYANGKAIATQQLAVPTGTRGTIFPMNVNPRLPAHVAVALTSTQPVAIERPTYFSNLSSGNAGVVSGAADIMGVQKLSSDWLFAEGYTASGFQENFAIANLDPSHTTANVTIKLEYGNGTVHSFPVTVAPLSQLIWNVNVGGGANPPTASVSAEISSTGVGIAVEREMFFRYTISVSGQSTPTVGGTDVLGAVGPLSSAAAYSFAEGYVNNGFVEFLTIQNPTANAETITVTLADEAGIFFNVYVVVNAFSRYTIDVGNIVLAYMYHYGDGNNGYEVSMALQSSSAFVAERPMYWNIAGTQGGTDAIGF